MAVVFDNPQHSGAGTYRFDDPTTVTSGGGTGSPVGTITLPAGFVLEKGQTGVVINSTGISPTSTLTEVLLGGEPLVIVSWTDGGGSAQIVVNVPTNINLVVSDYPLVVNHDAGYAQLDNVQLNAAPPPPPAPEFGEDTVTTLNLELEIDL